MKIKKVLAIVAFTVITIGMISVNSLAATFDIDASFDGKTITMTSENEEIGLNALNLLPGETDTSYINIANKGTEELKIYMTAKVIDDQELLKVLQIKITNSKDKEIFTGKYDDFEKVEIILAKGESEKLTIKTAMPKTAGNEYQNKEANIKFSFEANGEEIKVEEPPEEPVVIIPTYPKTNQSRMIMYAVLAIIVLILIIALIIISDKNKKKKDK